MTDDPEKYTVEDLFDRPFVNLPNEVLLLELTERIQSGDVRRADIEPLLAECIEYHEREISVLDWGDIRASVLLNELGEWRENGWVEQLTQALEQVRADALRMNPSAKLPIVVQIKQKLGGLRVYATSDSTPSLVQDIQSYVNRIETTCECCPNTADVQVIGGFATTLCAWCYNREIKDRSLSVEKLDIAKLFPDFAGLNLDSLLPDVGFGWMYMLSQHLKLIKSEISKQKLEPGTVQIRSVNVGPDGFINIDFSEYHDCLAPLMAKLKLASSSTCSQCGHRGDIVRNQDSEALCAYCSKEAS